VDKNPAGGFHIAQLSGPEEDILRHRFFDIE